jgi:hypothetical protein
VEDGEPGEADGVTGGVPGEAGGEGGAEAGSGAGRLHGCSPEDPLHAQMDVDLHDPY